MAGQMFYLKYRDTRPILEVVLKDPDGSVHDLTGATTFKLHMWLSDGTTKLTRDMTLFGPAANGTLRYTWLATDWDAGNLVIGPVLPLKPGEVEHRMEYEVMAGTARLTFPNDGYDVLRILTDIGQG